uniref:Calnexin n=1 Tax=Panagrellus redivivus TaxID=6233 RepID=A0A7E4VF71_PANRE
MRLKLWIGLVVAVLIAGVICDDEVEDGSPVEEGYIPPEFVPPTITEDEVYFFDWFNDPKAIGKKWFKSAATVVENGETISVASGNFEIGPPTNVILNGDLGLIVKNRARRHAIASALDKPFEFKGQPLILQYEVKYEEGQECGGGYLKLISASAKNQIKTFTDQTPYTIMFGPDKCGANARVHFIVKVKSLKNKDVITEHRVKDVQRNFVTYFEDKLSHLYTLTINADNTFSIQVDNTEIIAGNLLNDMVPPIQPPKEIPNPDEKKPDDWDEREVIDDPDAVKPDDWDESQPREIVDTDAVKPYDWLEDEALLIPDPSSTLPDDWDNELDGEWEPKLMNNPKCEGASGCGPWKQPLKANPLFKGKWAAPKIRNPAFKGKWAPSLIENPDYYIADPYKQLETVVAVGLELWTMSKDIILDNVLITDDVNIANRVAAETFTPKRNAEKIFNDAKGPLVGFLEGLINATEERPWLWVVYILALLIPVIGLSIYCCGQTSKQPQHSSHKKDDDVPDENDHYQEEQESADVDEQQPTTSDAPVEEPAVEDDTEEVSTGHSSPRATPPSTPPARQSDRLRQKQRARKD